MAGRPFVSRVESNIKGGVLVNLGPRTLLLGKTGSGKSAVVNAIELALTKRASDVRGRDESAQEATLMSMAPGRKGMMFSLVTLSDGTQARWETSGVARGGAKKATHTMPPGIIPDRVMPLRDVLRAVRAEPDAARRHFLRQVSGDVTDADILGLIPTQLQARFASYVVGTAATDTPIDKLLMAAERIASDVTATGGRMRAATKVAQGGMQGTQVAPPGEAEMQAVEVAIAAAKAQLEAATRLDAQAVMIATTQSNLAGTRTEISRLQTMIKDLTDKETVLVAARAQAQAQQLVLTGQAQVSPVAQVLGHAQYVMKHHVENSDKNCMACGAPVNLGELANRLAYVQTRMASVAQAQAQLAQVNAQLAQIEAPLKTIAEQRETAQNSIHRLTAWLNNVDPNALVPPQSVPDLSVLRTALAQAEARQAELYAANAAWSATKRSQDLAAGEEAMLAELHLLAKSCNQAIEQLLDKNVAEVCAKVQQRLPSTVRFGLSLRDGNRAIFDVGFVRDGILNSALSGGEWAMIASAMADVFAPATGPSIVVPMDRQMDADTLAEALKAWSSTDSQVIVTSVVAPTVVPPGWTVVNTDKGEHRTAGAVVAPTVAPTVAPVVPIVAPAPPALTLVPPVPVKAPESILATPLSNPATPPVVPAPVVPAAPKEKVRKPRAITRRKDESDAVFALRSKEYQEAMAAYEHARWKPSVALQTGTVCSVCRAPQLQSPGGVTCKNGHGGAPALPEVDPAQVTVLTDPVICAEGGRLKVFDAPGSDPDIPTV